MSFNELDCIIVSLICLNLHIFSRKNLPTEIWPAQTSWHFETLLNNTGTPVFLQTWARVCMYGKNAHSIHFLVNPFARSTWDEGKLSQGVGSDL